MLRRRADHLSVHVTTIAACDLLPVQHSSRLPPLTDNNKTTLRESSTVIPFRFRLKSATCIRKKPSPSSTSTEISNTYSQKRPTLKRHLSTLILPPISLEKRPVPVSIRSERSVIKRPPLRPLLNELSIIERPRDKPSNKPDAQCAEDILSLTYANAVSLHLQDLGGRATSLIEDDAYDKFARRKQTRRS